MSDYENVQSVQFGANPQAGNIHISTMSRPGGISEYHVSAGDTDEPLVSRTSQGASVQADVGGVTTTMGGRSVSAPSVSSFDTGDLAAGGTDFLATARNNGFPARGNLVPESIVSYQGIETSLANLEAIGIVRRTATGYEAVGIQADQGQQSQAKQELPQGVEYFNQDTESAVASAIEPVPQPIYDSAVAQVLEAGLDSINFNDLAYQSGMNPTEARQRAEMVLQAFSNQADQIVKTFGIQNPADVWEWAAEEHPEKFADVRRRMAFTRNTSPLKALVQEYMDTVPPTVEALRRGGYEVRQDATGQVVFNYKGRWMTPESATRAGLV